MSDLQVFKKFVPGILGLAVEPKGRIKRMSKRDMRDECYNCEHQRKIPGDSHISCVKPDSSMKGDRHGIRNGWFFYPFNFDPTWKTKLCKKYSPVKSKEVQADE